MFIKDPVITNKIHLIKRILKEFAVTERHNKHVFKNNFRVMKDNVGISRWFGDDKDWPQVQKDRIKKYIDSSWCSDSITALHVYFLKLKGVKKQHTKDDENYASSWNYKAGVEKFEKEFLVSQEVGKEGNHVS